MGETIEELSNFSIGIDLSGPDPTSNKNKAKKTRKFFSDTWVHLALIFFIFPVNFELFIHSYRLTG